MKTNPASNRLNLFRGALWFCSENACGSARRSFPRALLAGVAGLQLLLAGRGLALDPARTIYQFNCRNWTRQNGLPADKVSTVTQSKDGYLWLGTEEGLVRFDGLEFKVIPVDLPSAQGHDIRQLIALNDGKIAFAINSGGYGCYDGRTFSAIGDKRWSQPEMGANTIMEARDGAIWTGADMALGRWLKSNPAGTFFGNTNSGIVISLCEDAAGTVWMGKPERGLLRWADGKLFQIQDETLKKENIFALAAGPGQQIWVGTGLGLRCYAHGQVNKVAGFDYEVKALLVDRHGTLWAGTAGMGLARFENGKFVFLRKADGLASDYVTSLFEDAEGSLWVGTRDGLSQLSDLKFPIFSIKEGIGDGSSHSVAASKNGGLWISTDAGLTYFDGKTATNYAADSIFPNRYVKLCFEARNGNVFAEDGDKNVNIISGDRLLGRLTNSIWASAFTEDAESILMSVGTGDSLFRLHDGKLEHYQYQTQPPPDYYWINSMCVAKDGAIWVASKNGIFRVQAGAVKHWSTAEGLSGDNGLWVCQDADGSVWVGLSTGIARIKNGQIKNITSENGLADNWIYAVVPDNCGYFWCDSGRGIFRVSRQSLNDFTDGKVPRVACELFNDLEAVKSTGRTEQEDSGCKTLDGRVWFPCPWGVVMIDPAHIPTNEVAPPVHIDRVLANGKEYALGDDIIVPPGRGDLEFEFAGLSFIAPEKVKFRYQLEGFDNDWVNTEGRRQAFYTNLKPGRYAFHVIAANADGVWNATGDSLKIELRPYFRQTAGFYLLCGGLGLAVLAGIYVWRIRHLELKQLALQKARDQLETEVTNRTAELARANASLQHEVEEHRRTGEQLARRTQLLEGEIAERERMQGEVERVHQKLLEISRQAGMAEVATNVLHNVGNVLNSVNVSASLVTDQTKKSKVASLGKVVALLNEHTADLGVFLTNDPKGRQLLSYLGQLAGQLASEQQNAIQELELLRQNIEHIKDIVAMQQSYAKISGVTEIVKVSELAEDALRMNSGALARHDVAVEREYGDVPPVLVEKHKVLQILVNLIRNAKYACDDSGRADKQLKIKISRTDGHVAIAVVDNGIGIPLENLTRIFNHGFTTRKGGHGFGLHSGALAAAELGGSLTAHSDGQGRGAAFTLKLPLQPPKAG